MRRVAMVLLSIATAIAADKPRFDPKPAASYPGHQTASGITVAAVPYTREDEVKAAFGKANPYKYGVLPVLVVIQNDTGKAPRLNLKTRTGERFQDNSRATPLRPVDVTLWAGARNKDVIAFRCHRRFLSRGRKAVRWMCRRSRDWLSVPGSLPIGESVHGFFYFEGEVRAGSYLYHRTG